MEKIDLSTNSRKIQEAYDKVVRGDPSSNYVVYSVNNNSTLEVTATGSGPLDEFVEHFIDGHVQFGLARAAVPGSDVSKNLLLGWCPDNSPSKLRLSFASNFAEVSRALSGYHVQITARDQDDLDVNDFLERIGAAAGARYTQGSTHTPVKPAAAKPTVAVSKPAVKPAVKPASKPSYVPKSTGYISKAIPTVSADEWGGEKEIEERDFTKKPLEDVPSAYTPTKVNIAELRKQKSDTISSVPKPFVEKTQEASKEDEAPKSINDRLKAYKDDSSDGRLTSLPKFKAENSVASRFTPEVSEPSRGLYFGGAVKPVARAKPTFGSKPNYTAVSPLDKKDQLVGGLSKNFGSEGGKTPAQIWAEKRGQYKVVEGGDAPIVSGSDVGEKFEKTSIKQEESELDVEEPHVQEEEEEKNEAPVFPTRNLPPPVRNVQEEEEEEKNEAPVFPTRNLPPPAVVHSPELEAGEVRVSIPTRSLPPPPQRTVAPVKEVTPEPIAPKEEAKESLSAIAQYEYEKDEDNEIGFDEGDLIVEIELVDEEWWSGKHSKTGEVGLFPAAYVELKKGEEKAATPVAAAAPVAVSAPAAVAAPAAVPATSGPTATAEYDYEKDEDNEINFKEGDLIVEVEFVDDDWWSGKHKESGESGLFPANYVKLNE